MIKCMAYLQNHIGIDFYFGNLYYNHSFFSVSVYPII